MCVNIFPLEQVANHAPQVGTWIENEWRILPIHEYLKAVFHGKNMPSLLPRTLIAIDSSTNQPIGTASLLLNDMETRLDLNPWFGCLYVDPARRNCGVGTILIAQCLRLASQLKLRTLYLYTAHNESLYRKNGWEYITHEFYEGEKTTIMKINL